MKISLQNLLRETSLYLCFFVCLSGSAQKLSETKVDILTEKMSDLKVEKTQESQENEESGSLSEYSVIRSSGEDAPILVREDRVWKYYQRFNNMFEDYRDNTEIYTNLRFFGETEINGKVYKNCRIWAAENDFSPEIAPVIAYMREDNGKVYMIQSNYEYGVLEENYGVSIQPATSTACATDGNIEALIYDFNAAAGDVIYVNKDLVDDENAYDEVLWTTDFFDGKDNYTIQACKSHIFSKWVYSVVYGVGTTTGLLPFPGSFTYTSGMTPHSLLGLYDLNDNLIFDHESNMIFIDSVKNVDLDNSVTSEYFDVNGQRVETPVKGIYIKVDRKSDGTIQTTKIMR